MDCIVAGLETLALQLIVPLHVTVSVGAHQWIFVDSKYTSGGMRLGQYAVFRGQADKMALSNGHKIALLRGKYVILQAPYVSGFSQVLHMPAAKSGDVKLWFNNTEWYVMFDEKYRGSLPKLTRMYHKGEYMTIASSLDDVELQDGFGFVVEDCHLKIKPVIQITKHSIAFGHSSKELDAWKTFKLDDEQKKTVLECAIASGRLDATKGGKKYKYVNKHWVNGDESLSLESVNALELERLIAFDELIEPPPVPDV